MAGEERILPRNKNVLAPRPDFNRDTRVTLDGTKTEYAKLHTPLGVSTAYNVQVRALILGATPNPSQQRAMAKIGAPLDRTKGREYLTEVAARVLLMQLV